MPVQTKAQKDLIRAEELISAVAQEASAQPGLRQIYGGLCHSFPVLVRTCGLCQALAFHKDKATVAEGREQSDRNRAHELLLEHVGQIFVPATTHPLAQIQTSSAPDDMLQTRRVLSAWIYFKRFAVSILKVETSQSGEERGDD